MRGERPVRWKVRYHRRLKPPSTAAAQGIGFATGQHLRWPLVVTATLSGFFILRTIFTLGGEPAFSLFDDAMVSMRYAANLASGHGLVWNPGESPVEGYTNLLWTLWMAVLHFIPVPEQVTPLLVALSGAALLVGNAAAAARLCRLLSPESPAWVPATAALTVGSCYPLLYWTLRGMEVGLLTLLIALAVERALLIGRGHDQGRTWLALWLVLITLTRPDGVIPAAAIAVAASAASRSRRWSTMWLLLGVIAVTFGLHAVGRYAYYGDWLPNTYYLKMTGVPAAERVSRGILAARHNFKEYLLVPLLLTAAVSLNYHRLIDGLMIGIPALLIAYSIYVGGDAWEWMPYTNRYTTPALVIMLPAAIAAAATRVRQISRAATSLLIILGVIQLALAVFHAVSAIHQLTHSLMGLAAFAAAALTTTDRFRNVRVAIVAVLLGVSASAPGVREWMQTGGAHVRDDATMAVAGRAVHDFTSNQATIAVVWAGSLPYHAHRHAIDLLGKSDAVIARLQPVGEFMPGHNKWNYAHSIGLGRPDLVLQLWGRTPETDRWLLEIGYDYLTPNVFVRRDSQLVDRSRLAVALPTLPGQRSAALDTDVDPESGPGNIRR
jgi:arabinofuranosyltransferase